FVANHGEPATITLPENTTILHSLRCGESGSEYVVGTYGLLWSFAGLDLAIANRADTSQIKSKNKVVVMP
ncbi:hypothetical protein ACFLQU_05435, partial [Verrucomicrobiota bacterium]